MSIGNFFSKGYCVLDDFLPKLVADEMLETFQREHDWTQIDQVRDHYKKGAPFFTESRFFPSPEEKYYQRTKRAENLAKCDHWRKMFFDTFISKLEKAFGCRVVNDTTYILKYTEGDFARVHTDDLRGEVERVDIGILYYLCEDWRWDWGGLLLVGENSRSHNMEAIIPIHNRLVILNHQKKCPHTVTPVTHFAKNERYSIASFIGCETAPTPSKLHEIII